MSERSFSCRSDCTESAEYTSFQVFKLSIGDVFPKSLWSPATPRHTHEAGGISHLWWSPYLLEAKFLTFTKVRSFRISFLSNNFGVWNVPWDHLQLVRCDRMIHLSFGLSSRALLGSHLYLVSVRLNYGLIIQRGKIKCCPERSNIRIMTMKYSSWTTWAGFFKDGFRNVKQFSIRK